MSNIFYQTKTKERRVKTLIDINIKTERESMSAEARDMKKNEDKQRIYGGREEKR